MYTRLDNQTSSAGLFALVVEMYKTFSYNMQVHFGARNNMLANDILSLDSCTTELSATSQLLKGWLANLQHFFLYFGKDLILKRWYSFN